MPHAISSHTPRSRGERWCSRALWGDADQRSREQLGFWQLMLFWIAEGVSKAGISEGREALAVDFGFLTDVHVKCSVRQHEDSVMRTK